MRIKHFVRRLQKKGESYYDSKNNIVVFKSSNFKDIAESIKAMTDLYKSMNFKIVKIENKIYKIKFENIDF